ncbi:Mg-chelatase subunit ChlD [Halovivax ruber XH-70]|uniref:Mg-chelatase subunit ChlD n=1 Tax=Halovivax ruber (strain DSM 18193 / JCM 13892 / XH-70) TaxID=797302 RepID=L0IEU6_HALRX|nr:VWA domain-containing protein [Halovivax ruber]AGB16492.1 Mg-chelatase subunit ChlD [Halovivax ruber XH-70]
MPTQLSTKVNRPYLPEDGGGVTCELLIEPDAQDQPAQRHIALCVDSSGSMAYSKMDQVQDATKLVFGLLNDDDYLSIITFDNEVDVIMDATRWGDIEREEAEERLENIETGGGTDIYAGLEEARKSLVELDGSEDISKRILLLSDGRDLRAKPPDFEPLAKAIATAGISVYSAGIGTNYGKEVIRTVGEHSQGRWAHVEKPTDIRSFFGDVVQEASTVLANNPELVIDPIEGCEVGMAFRRLPQVQQIDLEYEEDGSVVVGLPDLQDRERQEIVLKMDAPPGTVGDEQVIADVELDSDAVDASTALSVTYSDDAQELSQHETEVTLAYHDTDLRTRIAHADSPGELEEVREKIDETEVITGETEIADVLRENVTRIEQGDESEARKVQENTTVVFDDSQFN